jgi:hypothetical protein
MLHPVIIHRLPPATSFSMEKVTGWLYQLKVYCNNHQGECFPWRGIRNVLSAYIWKSVVSAFRRLISATCKTQGHDHIFKDLNTQIIRVWFAHTLMGGFSFQCNVISWGYHLPPPTPHRPISVNPKIKKCPCSSFRWDRSHNYKVEIWDWKKREREFVTSTPYLIATPASVSSLETVCSM